MVCIYFLFKVCRKCYVSDGTTSISKETNVSKYRPYYEPPLIGITSDRASKSWHFIRRDYVCKKKYKLHKNRCNEYEYSEKYLSDASSGRK